MIFYFTGTGNSFEVAKALGEELVSIPQVMKSGQVDFEAETIGLIFPCYHFGMPRMVREFLNKVNLKADYLFCVATCGNMVGDTLNQVKALAENRNIHFNYLDLILMADNYLPMFEMEKELEALPKKNVSEKIKEIKAAILSKTNYIPKITIGMKIFAKMMSGGNKKILGGKSDEGFSVNKNCNSCGTCLTVCPTANIVVGNNTIAYNHNCESCFACIHACPQTAINIEKEKSSVRFRNGNVTLKELISANNVSN